MSTTPRDQLHAEDPAAPGTTSTPATDVTSVTSPRPTDPASDPLARTCAGHLRSLEVTKNATLFSPLSMVRPRKARRVEGEGTSSLSSLAFTSNKHHNKHAPRTYGYLLTLASKQKRKVRATSIPAHERASAPLRPCRRPGAIRNSKFAIPTAIAQTARRRPYPHRPSTIVNRQSPNSPPSPRRTAAWITPASWPRPLSRW